MEKFKSVLKLTRNAQEVSHMLQGVFVVYKPPEEHIKQLESTLKYHLCRDLNKLEPRPLAQHVWIEGETNKKMTVAVGPSYADHPLLTGPRYQPDEMKITFANKLFTESSGVLLVAINNGSRIARAIRQGQPPKFYKIKGTLGQATDNYFRTGRVLEKSTWKHVRRDHIDKICASMQSSYQKKMFEICGVPIQSQAAFELAVQGPIRPADSKIPMVYSIKCIDFQPPDFLLEIVCINDDKLFLQSIVHEIGMQVRSTAFCSQIQCVRFGLFTLDHALLKKHWNLEQIAHNMAKCRNILHENKFLKDQRDPILKEYSTVKQIEASEKLSITG